MKKHVWFRVKGIVTHSVLIAGVVFLSLYMIGCGGPKAPDNMPRIFVSETFDGAQPNAYHIHPGSKYATYESELKRHCTKLPAMDHRDYAMLSANRAQIEYALGHVEAAGQAALDSQAIMTGHVKGEEDKAAAATIAQEGAKVFKGECYENAMLNCMVGICNLVLGDSETAAIGFRRALEADKMSKEEQRDDFELAYWGLAMASIDNDPSGTKVALKHCGYKDYKTVKEENMVFLVSIGRAPVKLLSGLYGEYDEIHKSRYEPTYAELYVDEQKLGKSFKLVDLFEQSQGVPRSGKDVGQGGKAVGKLLLASVAGAFLGDAGQNLVESGWNVCADWRVCYMLPNEFHVASGKVKPGMHTVCVKFYDAKGTELKRYEQVWHHIKAPQEGRRYVSIRSEFDRCNVQGSIPFTRISKVKTTKNKENDEQTVWINFRVVNIPNVKIGDTLKVCHFYTRTEYRTDIQHNWRYAPMRYNSKGEPVGHPGVRFRMQDYDIGLIGKAEVTEIEKETGRAKITSFTTEYQPHVDDMVTLVRKQGRIWQ